MTIHFIVKETILIIYPFMHVSFFFRRQMTRTITIIITKTPAIEPPIMASEIRIEHMCVNYFFPVYVVYHLKPIHFSWQKTPISFSLFQKSKVVLTQCAIIRARGRYLVVLDSTVYICIRFKCCCCRCCRHSSCRCWGYILARMVTRHSHSRCVVTTSDIES